MVKRHLRFEPVDEGISLKDRIYVQLKAAIDAVDLYDPALDLRLDERELASLLDCSRTPLREALTRLENDGILRIVPRKGVFLIRKSKAEIVDMIRVWAGIESVAVRMAAERASDSDLAALADKATLADSEPSTAEVEGFDKTDVDFHFSIIRMSECEPLKSVAAELYAHIRGVRKRIEHTARQVEASTSEHAEIVAALTDRNADRAEQLVRNHVMGLARFVDEQVELPA